MSRRAFTLASLVVLMIIWGSTFVVTKAAVAEIPPLALSALRFVIAAGVLMPVAAVRGVSKSLPRPFPLVPLALMALTGIALFHVGFNYGLFYASASQGALIFALVPAAVTAAAMLALGERPSKRRIVGIVLSIGGVVIIVATGETDRASPNPFLGALSMLGAVAAWAVYTVIAKRLAEADQVVVMACAVVMGASMLLPLAAVELAYVPWPTPSLKGWLGAMFLGVVASAIAFTMYNRALRELDASLVGAYLNLDPIIGVLTAVIFLGEALSPGQMVGGVVALGGMWLASADESKRESNRRGEGSHGQRS